jgi:ribosomal protein S18 acetylase RimI-like enzyme
MFRAVRPTQHLLASQTHSLFVIQSLPARSTPIDFRIARLLCVIIRCMATTANTYQAIANPIWQAATTRQRHLAYGEGPVRRFYSEVVPLAALENHSADAVAALTAMVSPGECVWLFEEPPHLDPERWRETMRVPGFQMVCDALSQEARPAGGPPPVTLDVVMLDTRRDAAAMNALKAIAFPGFFGMRTPEMGRYRGICVDGELVAMAGERLAVPGYREVSAICTHPAHLGHGYAQRLSREATAGILADGDTAFLHVAGGNGAAIHIYEQLGFRPSADALFVQLERLGQ